MVYERCIVNKIKDHLKIHLGKSGDHNKTSSFKQSKFHLKYLFRKYIVKKIFVRIDQNETLCIKENNIFTK